MNSITKERIELFIENPLENGLTRSEQLELAEKVCWLERDVTYWKDKCNTLSSALYSPSAGEVCEVWTNYSEWVKIKVVAVYKSKVAAIVLDEGRSDFDSLEVFGWAYDGNIFRPLGKPPFEQWLEQQREKIDVDCGCVSTETLMHWMRVAYAAGNSPVTPSDVARGEQ